VFRAQAIGIKLPGSRASAYDRLIRARSLTTPIYRSMRKNLSAMAQVRVAP